jgi:hypothetical protein
MGVARVSQLEWWVTRIQNEEDDSKREQINDVSLIWFFSKDFWGHVSLSSEMSLEGATAVSALNRGCESEVSNSNIELIVKHNVFRLEVAMSSTF